MEAYNMFMEKEKVNPYMKKFQSFSNECLVTFSFLSSCLPSHLLLLSVGTERRSACEEEEGRSACDLEGQVPLRRGLPDVPQPHDGEPSS